MTNDLLFYNCAIRKNEYLFEGAWKLESNFLSLTINFSNHPSQKYIKFKKSFFVQRKIVRNNNFVFSLWIDINFSLFLVEFCQYLEYSIWVFKLVACYSWLTVVVSFIFNCKKNIELTYLKCCNNFVQYIILYTWIRINFGISLYTVFLVTFFSYCVFP